DRIPTRDYPAAGGLLSYGTDLREAWRQVGIYTGKIVRGTKPAELPVQQAVKFELVINRGNRDITRHRGAAGASRDNRRGHRIRALSAAMHMAEIGPKPKWLNVCFCAAVGGQADIKRA